MNSPIHSKLAEIRERLKKATPGVWHIGHVSEVDDSCDIDSQLGLTLMKVIYRQDQAFIANAPTDISYLLTALEQALVINQRLASALIVAKECRRYCLGSDASTRNMIDRFDKALAEIADAVLTNAGWTK